VETTSKDDGQSDRYDETTIVSARHLVGGRPDSRQGTPTGKIIVIIIVVVELQRRSRYRHAAVAVVFLSV